MSRILLENDDPEIVVLVKIILERAGHEVVVTRASGECLEKIGDIEPDLILLDSMMPNLNGWEICRKIKGTEETRKIPVAMFTELNCDDSWKKSLELGADAYIDTPFEINELLGMVERLIEKTASP